MMTFHEKIRTLSSLYRFRVSSYGRDPEGNAHVGGVPDSKHLLWLAMDIILWDRDSDLEGFLFWCKRLGLWTLDEGHHIHVHEDL